MNTSASPDISLRLLQTWDEYLAAEEIQRVVWQMPDWRDAVPANMMITVQKNGGIALGAFDGERLVGLAFGFIGLDQHLDKPVLKQCSHMLAVLPEYQSLKIGVRLKLLQRELTLAQGITLMTWTYDPLLSINANLNLVRLGAVARRYIPDAYGEMTDGLNVGLASDRLEVEWWLASHRVQARTAGAAPRVDWQAAVHAGARAVFDVAAGDARLPRIRDVGALEGDRVLVEIPQQMAALKAAAPELAREWREQTRRVFTRAFAAGYTATDFVRDSNASRCAYLLTRDPVET